MRPGGRGLGAGGPGDGVADIDGQPGAAGGGGRAGRRGRGAGGRATLVVEALDPDSPASGGPEAVWLSAAAWSAGPSPGPRIEIHLSPPRDAAPGSYRLVAGATDARGLTTVRTYGVAVLGPRCGGALEILEGGACRTCGEHEVPDASGTGCAACPAGTERSAGAGSCAPCAPGRVSEPGGACGCGPAHRLEDGACVECPPNMEAAAAGAACAACPLGTGRPAGSASCADCGPAAPCAVAASFPAKSRPLAGAAAMGVRGAGSAPTVVVGVEPTTLSEDVGQVRARLTLENPPAAGNYTGCRLRLGAGGAATTPRRRRRT